MVAIATTTLQLDEDSVSNHYGDRKIKIDDSVSMVTDTSRLYEMIIMVIV